VIRVLIADDHAIVRGGLTELVDSADDLDLVGQAKDGKEAVALAAELTPDVILMDIAMPELDGIAATRAILEDNPGIQVVALTSFSDRERILAALEAGAIGYLLKDATPDELLAGIRSAARGDSPLAPKAARTFIQALTQGRPQDELSARELEILVLVAAGHPNKIIAQRLGITERTVKAHLTSIYRRIGVGDRVQAALWAYERGIGGTA